MTNLILKMVSRTYTIQEASDYIYYLHLGNDHLQLRKYFTLRSTWKNEIKQLWS